MKLDLIQPDLFSHRDDVQCFFTKSNRHIAKLSSSGIEGLHLGLFSHGDEISVKKNYSFLFNEIEWNEDQIAVAKQIHGTRVMTVEEPGIYSDCDGFITKNEGLALGIQVADCAAVVLYEPAARIIAIMHAGWRGAVSGILIEGMNSIKSLGGDLSKLFAYISPCISLQNFEVGEEVASLFPESFCDYVSYDKPHIDLKGYLVSQLTAEGVLMNNIESSSGCTYGDDQFYSYRREGQNAGRMLALIKMN